MVDFKQFNEDVSDYVNNHREEFYEWEKQRKESQDEHFSSDIR